MSRELIKAGRPASPALAFGGAWEYAPVAEAIDRAIVARRWDLFVGGRWRAPTSRKYVPTIAPATEDVLAEVAEANARDVNDAVRAARRACDGAWSRTRPAERTRCLLRLARAVEDKARELSVVESMDAGRPITASRDLDLPLAAAYLAYYAGWADKLEYAFQGRRPRAPGVVAQILSCDGPLVAAVASLAPALACGNTVVLKPSEATPLSALMLARAVEESGLPPGVFNVVTGGAATAEALAANPGVAVVAFAGSRSAGAAVRRAALGANLADDRLAMQWEGRTTVVVFADAALDQAVDAVARGLYAHLGQGTLRAPVVLVEESAHDRLVCKWRDRLATLRVGDPLDRNTDVGPIASRARLEKVLAHVEAAEREGGARYASPASLPDRGHWLAPTLLTNLRASSPVVREPIAGPVLSVLTFRTPEEAVAVASTVSDGRCASVWTEKGSKALWFAQQTRARVLWANAYGKVDASSPFGLAGGLQGLLAYGGPQ